MMRKLILLFILTCGLIIGCYPSRQTPSAPRLFSTPATPAIDISTKQRGVSWTAGPQPITLENLKTLQQAHVTWIAQNPFGWQQDYNSPELTLKTTGVYWGETDQGLAQTTQFAHELGIETLLKPQIWLMKTHEGKWLTDIAMNSEQDWQTWFKNYHHFMLHYAKFAAQHNIPILCIGTELQSTAVQRAQDWRQLIADIRQVYQGQLTYAANWSDAFEQIQFWDDLDLIGIQAYFPLATQNSPTVEQLKASWQPHLDQIAAIKEKYQKPVIFTEIGYRSTEDAAIKPWQWPDASELNPSPPATEAGLVTQANCYEAFFQTVWSQDWFAGAYWWKWFPEIKPEQQSRVGQGFTPQNKPAEQILRHGYGTEPPKQKSTTLSSQHAPTLSRRAVFNLAG